MKARAASVPLGTIILVGPPGARHLRTTGRDRAKIAIRDQLPLMVFALFALIRPKHGRSAAPPIPGIKPSRNNRCSVPKKRHHVLKLQWGTWPSPVASTVGPL